MRYKWVFPALTGYHVAYCITSINTQELNTRESRKHVRHHEKNFDTFIHHTIIVAPTIIIVRRRTQDESVDRTKVCFCGASVFATAWWHYWSWPPCGSSGGAISRWWCVLMSAKVILGASAVVVSGGRQRWSSAQDGSATLGADLGGCAVLISV